MPVFSLSASLGGTTLARARAPVTASGALTRLAPFSCASLPQSRSLLYEGGHAADLPDVSSSSSRSLCGPLAHQRRYWYDIGASKKQRDKPLISGTDHIYVKAQIPIVMLETVRGIGRKGQIVSVKRGYARHHLVPKGLALLGTWENIDEYADPALVEDPTLKARMLSERGRLPFDWVDEVRVQFVRRAREDQLNILLEPITVWDILQELSSNHELDLLAGNLDVPEGGVLQVGTTEVPVRIAFRDPEVAAGRYTIGIEVVSEQSLLEELKRKEMASALTESGKFSIPRRFDASEGEGDFDDEPDDPPALAGR